MIKEWVIIMSLFPISLLSKAKELPVLSIERIKCEYRINPLGIDETHPRFSWIFHAIKRNQYQAYYRILVSSSPENLLKNIGDIWDSGKLPSEDNIQVYFRGKTLHSFSRYFWKVKAWTQHSFETPWSRPGDFETAFLSDAAWQGKWIGTGEKVPEKDEGFYKDIPAPWFRKTFQISKPIRSARLYISGLGYYEAYLNGNNTLAFLLVNCWYNPLPMKLFRVFNLLNTLTIGQPRMIADLRIIFKDGNSMFISSDEPWETADSYILK